VIDSALRQLAHALIEHETLNSDEVRRVIKGEPIRDLTEKIMEAAEQEGIEKDLPQPTAS
jgi:ATP-dependent metalloprotease